MKCEVRQSDTGPVTRTVSPGGLAIEVIEVDAEVCGRGTLHVGVYCLDENQAVALVKAVEAGIAQIQARAVSR